MTDSSPSSIHAVGRRKTSTARVILRPGSGTWSVNGKPLENYFPRDLHRIRVVEPLKVVDGEGQFDIIARVRGGGVTGQADAIRLAVSRALVERDGETRPSLRQEGMLTRDPRKVERKKPGRPKARKRFQFSKR
jgi:small subunit ribosomal protein S9